MNLRTSIGFFLITAFCNLLPAGAGITVLPPNADYVRTMLKGIEADDGVSRDISAKRKALVIGIDNYDHLRDLENPRNDATAVAKGLQSIGFEVKIGIDLDLGAFEKAIADFTRALDETELAIVFFAGHGMEINGQNYMLAQEAGVEGEKFVGAVPVDPLLKRMRRIDSGAMLILDACRDTGLAGSTLDDGRVSRSIGRGLTQVQLPEPENERGAGIYIAYSTAPNRVALDGDGVNSPFTKAFLKHLTSPGVPISTVMSQVAYETAMATQSQQIPWTASSLKKEVYLNGQVGEREVRAVAEVQASNSAKLLAEGHREEAIAEALKGLPAMYQEASADLTLEAYLALCRAYRSNVAVLQTTEVERRRAYIDDQNQYVVTSNLTVGLSDSFSVYDFASGRLLKECYAGSPDVEFDEIKGFSMNREGTVATLTPVGLFEEGMWVTTWKTGRFDQEQRWRIPSENTSGKLSLCEAGRWILTATDKVRLSDARDGALLREFEAPTPPGFEVPTPPEPASLEDALERLNVTQEALARIRPESREALIKEAEKMRARMTALKKSSTRLSVAQRMAIRPFTPGISSCSEFFVASFYDYAADANKLSMDMVKKPSLIAVWTKSNSEPIHTLNGHQGPLYQVFFAADAPIMASTSYDRTTRIWNIKNGTALAIITDDIDSESATLSPDGRYLSAKLKSGKQYLWDTYSGIRIAPSTAAQVTAYNYFFNAEGRSIAPTLASHRAWAPSPEGNDLLQTAFSELSESLKDEVSKNRVRYWHVD